MNVTAEFAGRIGGAVRAAAEGKGLGWYGHHMAAATRAVLERVPLVDLTLEVRDARIPISSACKWLDDGGVSSFRRVVVLNKADLADPFETKKWVKCFEELNFPCYEVNSHNKDNIKEFMNFLRARVRELKACDSDYTAAVMLVGVPNVGKSAMANSLHQIGRISAAEKGKLKHAVVSPSPGETKDINSYKIASHPNIYVLDTPGILLPKILDDQVVSKLVLTGAIKDDIIGKVELAEYLLAIVNTAENYKEWEILINEEEADKNINIKPRKKQYATDHTQDFIVRDVRHNLFKSVSSFDRNLEHQCNMIELIKNQFSALHEAFRISEDLSEDGKRSVAKKILDLYRTGRLGHYTLDAAPI